jgi:hypothetical protein
LASQKALPTIEDMDGGNLDEIRMKENEIKTLAR